MQNLVLHHDMATLVYLAFSAISSKTNHLYAISVISFYSGMYENSADGLCAVLIFVFQFVLNTPNAGQLRNGWQRTNLIGV